MEQQYAAFQPSSKATTEPVRSFSTNSRPALRAAACGGRPRAGSDATATGEPASPIPPRSTLTSMGIPTLTPRGFWTRIVVFGASLLVYAWGVRLMAREHSIVGILGIAVFSLLILFSGGGLIATLMSRSPRRSR
jgi:hypothetical protein